ncbi:MAG TPA: SET domain-containing protein, partial [Bacillota bacterium]|nr:SET domain-containing protein [Bacillota bacterium]
SPIHGMGCFTVQDIAKDQAVWEFHPQVDRRYSLEELAKLPPIIVDFFHTYAWLNPADKHILFTGDHSKFFNHSDTPNTAMTVDGYKCLAKRDIIAGEELTIDYAELPDIPDLVLPGRKVT